MVLDWSLSLGHELKLNVTPCFGPKLYIALCLGLQLFVSLGVGLKLHVPFVPCTNDSSGQIVAAYLWRPILWAGRFYLFSSMTSSLMREICINIFQKNRHQWIVVDSRLTTSWSGLNFTRWVQCFTAMFCKYHCAPSFIPSCGSGQSDPEDSKQCRIERSHQDDLSAFEDEDTTLFWTPESDFPLTQRYNLWAFCTTVECSRNAALMIHNHVLLLLSCLTTPSQLKPQRKVVKNPLHVKLSSRAPQEGVWRVWRYNCTRS